MAKPQIRSAFPKDAFMQKKEIVKNIQHPKSVIESLFEDGRVQTASRVMMIMIDKNVGVEDNMDLAAKIVEALLMRGHVEEALGRIDLLNQNGHSAHLDSLLYVLSEKGKTIAALKLLDFGLERDLSLEFSS